MLSLGACQPRAQAAFAPLDNGFPELVVTAVTGPPSHELVAPAQTPTPPDPVATPATEGPPPVDLAAVAYTLRHLSPTTLIELAFADLGPAAVEKAKVIACREGGIAKGPGRTWQIACSPSHRIEPAPPMSCGADNPTSSASGAFQFMGSWAGWGGFSWADVVGPDCYTDVMMAAAVVRSMGWGPWS